jgi:hypothetical protein
MVFSEGGATKGGVDDVNLAHQPQPHPTPDVTPAPTTPQTPPYLDGGGHGQMTPPSSPFTDTTTTSSSALALSSSSAFATVSAVGTPNTDLTSLPSDVSKLSLGLGPATKKPFDPITEQQPPPPPPAAVSWPYSHSAALDDIPDIAYALDTFLKSQMVEAEEYCHRNDPKKYVSCCHFDLMACL